MKIISYTSPTYCHKGLDLFVGNVGDNLVKKTKIEILLCENWEKRKKYIEVEKKCQKNSYISYIFSKILVRVRIWHVGDWKWSPTKYFP